MTTCEVVFGKPTTADEEAIALAMDGTGCVATVQGMSDATTELRRSLQQQGITTRQAEGEGDFTVWLSATDLAGALAETFAFLRGFLIACTTYTFERRDGERFIISEYYPATSGIVFTAEHARWLEGSSRDAEQAMATLNGAGGKHSKWDPGSTSFELDLEPASLARRYDQLVALVAAFPAGPIPL